MASRIGKIHVNYSEYCYFDYLEGAEKMNYFFQLFEGVSGKTQMDLSGFFTQINEEYNEEDMEPVVRLKKDVPEDQDRVDIMIDEEFIEAQILANLDYKIGVENFFERLIIFNGNKN